MQKCITALVWEAGVEHPSRTRWSLIKTLMPSFQIHQRCSVFCLPILFLAITFLTQHSVSPCLSDPSCAPGAKYRAGNVSFHICAVRIRNRFMVNLSTCFRTLSLFLIQIQVSRHDNIQEDIGISALISNLWHSLLLTFRFRFSFFKQSKASISFPKIHKDQIHHLHLGWMVMSTGSLHSKTPSLLSE